LCGTDAADGVLEPPTAWPGGGREGSDMRAEWCRKAVMKENTPAKYGVFVAVKVVGGWSA